MFACSRAAFIPESRPRRLLTSSSAACEKRLISGILCRKWLLLFCRGALAAVGLETFGEAVAALLFLFATKEDDQEQEQGEAQVRLLQSDMKRGGVEEQRELSTTTVVGGAKVTVVVASGRTVVVVAKPETANTTSEVRPVVPYAAANVTSPGFEIGEVKRATRVFRIS